MSDEIDGTESAAPIDSNDPRTSIKLLLWMWGYSARNDAPLSRPESAIYRRLAWSAGRPAYRASTTEGTLNAVQLSRICRVLASCAWSKRLQHASYTPMASPV